MTSFSIDDVRETMPREVTEFLARIEVSRRRVGSDVAGSSHEIRCC